MSSRPGQLPPMHSRARGLQVFAHFAAPECPIRVRPARTQSKWAIETAKARTPVPAIERMEPTSIQERMRSVRSGFSETPAESPRKRVLKSPGMIQMNQTSNNYCSQARDRLAAAHELNCATTRASLRAFVPFVVSVLRFTPESSRSLAPGNSPA